MQSRSLVRRLVGAGSACSAVAISVALGASAQEEAVFPVESAESVELQSVDPTADAFSDAARGGHGGHAAGGGFLFGCNRIAGLVDLVGGEDGAGGNVESQGDEAAAEDGAENLV